MTYFNRDLFLEICEERSHTSEIQRGTTSKGFCFTGEKENKFSERFQKYSQPK